MSPRARLQRLAWVSCPPPPLSPSLPSFASLPLLLNLNFLSPVPLLFPTVFIKFVIIYVFFFMVPSSASWPYLAQKSRLAPILRSHSCAAFPVEFFISKKNVHHVHTTVCLGSTNNLCLGWRLKHVHPLETT